MQEKANFLQPLVEGFFIEFFGFYDCCIDDVVLLFPSYFVVIRHIILSCYELQRTQYLCCTVNVELFVRTALMRIHLMRIH